MIRRSRTVACSLALFLAACSSSASPPSDAGSGGDDASQATDAGAPRDAHAATDAPSGHDAGASADAGQIPRDAFVPALDSGSTCANDDREPDDNVALARAHPAIYSLRATTDLGTRVACPGDVDIYYAHADCCTSAGAEISWLPAEGSLEVTLLDEHLEPIVPDIEESFGTTLRILKNDFGGDFYVQVRSTTEERFTYQATIHAFVYGP